MKELGLQNGQDTSRLSRCTDYVPTKFIVYASQPRGGVYHNDCQTSDEIVSNSYNDIYSTLLFRIAIPESLTFDSANNN